MCYTNIFFYICSSGKLKNLITKMSKYKHITGYIHISQKSLVNIKSPTDCVFCHNKLINNNIANSN